MSPMASLLEDATVLPILTVETEAAALPLAETLVESGITVFEVVLRTPAAAAAAGAMQRAFPQARVGLGTLLDARDVATAVAAGVAFGVSPGLTPDLAAAARRAGLPLLPGVQTASDVMAAKAAGFDVLKLFPAGLAGGVEWLRSMAPVFPGIRFCPTGGIGPDQIPAYLGTPNCRTVGGSWMAPRALIDAGDWPAIRALAARAAAFRRPIN